MNFETSQFQFLLEFKTPPSHLIREAYLRTMFNSCRPKITILFQIQHTSRSMTKPKNECAPSEDTDQPGHPPSLIRVFAVRLMGS